MDTSARLVSPDEYLRRRIEEDKLQTLDLTAQLTKKPDHFIMMATGTDHEGETIAC